MSRPSDLLLVAAVLFAVGIPSALAAPRVQTSLGPGSGDLVTGLVVGGLDERSHERPASEAPDTLDITRKVRQRLGRYYLDAGNRSLPPHDVLARQSVCTADAGHSCYGGDPDFTTCPIDEPCAPRGSRTELLDYLLATSREHPDAGFVLGYTVYALMKFGRQLDAFELVNSCGAAPWWCLLLRGYVFNGVGRTEEAERHFREAFATAPDSIVCTLTEASWALAGRPRERLQALPCAERLPASDTVWWLSRPLYSSAVNDRWTEHVGRMLSTRFFYLEVRDSHLGRPVAPWLRELLLSWRIPRGTWDSWRWLQQRDPNGYYFNPYTSQKAARYHFVPDFEDGQLARPIWRLDATLEDEGYTPAFGSFYELPAQFARFRRADSMLVAVAGTLAGTPLADASGPAGHLILSDGPASFPLQLVSAFQDRRAVFIGRVSPKRYVASYEVL